MFFYKHTETIECVKKVAYFWRKIQTLGVNNSRITWLKMRNFQGIIFAWIETQGDFPICISVPLSRLPLGIYYWKNIFSKIQRKFQREL